MDRSWASAPAAMGRRKGCCSWTCIGVGMRRGSEQGRARGVMEWGRKRAGQVLPFLKGCSLQPLVGAGGMRAGAAIFKGGARCSHWWARVACCRALVASASCNRWQSDLAGRFWLFVIGIRPWLLHKISSLIYTLQFLYRT
jgi:hypothetical protein